MCERGIVWYEVKLGVYVCSGESKMPCSSNGLKWVPWNITTVRVRVVGFHERFLLGRGERGLVGKCSP